MRLIIFCLFLLFSEIARTQQIPNRNVGIQSGNTIFFSGPQPYGDRIKKNNLTFGIKADLPINRQLGFYIKGAFCNQFFFKEVENYVFYGKQDIYYQRTGLELQLGFFLNLGNANTLKGNDQKKKRLLGNPAIYAGIGSARFSVNRAYFYIYDSSLGLTSQFSISNPNTPRFFYFLESFVDFKIPFNIHERFVLELHAPVIASFDLHQTSSYYFAIVPSVSWAYKF